MQSYEVEVKALLGSADRARAVRDAMAALDPDCEVVSTNKQLNHYFEPSTQPGPGGGTLTALASGGTIAALASGGTIAALATAVAPHLSAESRAKLDDLAQQAKSFSVRTRDKDNIVLLVVKASVGDDTSENGVARMEFEAQVPLTVGELDEIVLSAGFSYQAKWSREREEYVCDGITVCIDKNAGYGYVAEFERVVDDASKLEAARADIDALMQRLGVAELPQDRLERMFAFYNKHWPEYYGTDRIFTIE